jgi:hypothetical protein
MAMQPLSNKHQSLAHNTQKSPRQYTNHSIWVDTCYRCSSQIRKDIKQAFVADILLLDFAYRLTVLVL